MGVCIDELLLLSSKLINFHDHSELKEDLIGMQKFGYLVTVVCSLVPCPSPLRNVDGQSRNNYRGRGWRVVCDGLTSHLGGGPMLLQLFTTKIG